RVKDMITIGGLKVFPAEVERVLLDHPAIAQAAVVGAPDSVFGEQVVAFVVLATDSEEQQTLEELQQHAKTHLGNYKIPRKLTAIETLPRNPSGKILKTKLRELAAEMTTESLIDASNEDQASMVSNLRPASLKKQLTSVHPSEKLRVTTLFLCELAKELGELESLPSAADSFVESGLDSLAMVALGTQLQVEVGPEPELPPTLLFDYPRIGELASWLVDVCDEGRAGIERISERPSGRIDSESRATKSIEDMSEDEALAELMKELQ
ncbi:MAG: phosphopantetheine-binding protein, partial [Planctomycetota bacterium]